MALTEPKSTFAVTWIGGTPPLPTPSPPPPPEEPLLYPLLLLLLLLLLLKPPPAPPPKADLSPSPLACMHDEHMPLPLSLLLLPPVEELPPSFFRWRSGEDMSLVMVRRMADARVQWADRGDELR